MKMKYVLGLMILAVLFVACGGGSGPKAVMEKVAVVTENLITAMEKADSGAAVAGALNAYTDAMEKLAPEMKAVMEKHPELKNMKDDNVPDEYKEVMGRMNKAGERMMAAMMKMGQYIQDEAVMKAQQRLTEVMGKMQ